MCVLLGLHRIMMLSRNSRVWAFGHVRHHHPKEEDDVPLCGFAGLWLVTHEDNTQRHDLPAWPLPSNRHELTAFIFWGLHFGSARRVRLTCPPTTKSTLNLKSRRQYVWPLACAAAVADGVEKCGVFDLWTEARSARVVLEARRHAKKA